MTCPKGCCESYKAHLKAIAIGNFPSPTTLTERKWDKDMRAYKNLRRDGLQPKQIDGSYIVERNAKTKQEVELGRPVSDAGI